LARIHYSVQKVAFEVVFENYKTHENATTARSYKTFEADGAKVGEIFIEEIQILTHSGSSSIVTANDPARQFIKKAIVANGGHERLQRAQNNRTSGTGVQIAGDQEVSYTFDQWMSDSISTRLANAKLSNGVIWGNVLLRRGDGVWRRTNTGVTKLEGDDLGGLKAAEYVRRMSFLTELLDEKRFQLKLLNLKIDNKDK